MTNADKYLKDGVDVEEIENAYAEYLTTKVGLHDVDIKNNVFMKFLREPIKPTLTEDEKVILKNIRDFENDSQTFIIGRNEAFSGLYVGFIYEYSNGKGTTGVSEHKEPFRIYNHLFQFIQPRRRI